MRDTATLQQPSSGPSGRNFHHHLDPFAAEAQPPSMSMLSNSSNFVLNLQNSQLINHSAAEGSGRRILLAASLPGAMHDSRARELALCDIPETEQDDLVDKFTVWALLADAQFVMWTKGPKSTLVQIFAERAKEQLAATFFFSRSQGMNNPTHFFTTISLQFATNFPQYATLVEDKLRHDPTLVTKSLKDQFHELIAAPFQELSRQGVDLGSQRLIIVEGIEECEDMQARCEILRIILGSAGGLGFRWAVFSEQDHELLARLTERGSLTESCWMIDHSGLGSADSDGRVYFRVDFIDQGGRVVHWAIITWGFYIPLKGKWGENGSGSRYSVSGSGMDGVMKGVEGEGGSDVFGRAGSAHATTEDMEKGREKLLVLHSDDADADADDWESASDAGIDSIEGI